MGQAQVLYSVWWVFKTSLLIWVELIWKEKRKSFERSLVYFFSLNDTESSCWRNITQVNSEGFVSKNFVTIWRDVQHSFGVGFIFSFFIFYTLLCLDFCQWRKEKWFLCLIKRRGKKYEWLIKFSFYAMSCRTEHKDDWLCCNITSQKKYFLSTPNVFEN